MQGQCMSLFPFESHRKTQCVIWCRTLLLSVIEPKTGTYFNCMPLCSADKTISVFLWEYFVLLNYPNISELMLRLIDGRIVSRFTKQARGHLAWPAFRMTIEFELIFKKNIHRFESIEIGFVCRRRRLPLVVLLSMKLVRFLHTILFFVFVVIWWYAMHGYQIDSTLLLLKTQSQPHSASDSV